MTSTEDVARMLERPCEDPNLEFKEGKTQYDSTKLLKYCVAIANEGGGKFILGVSDFVPRLVVGSEAFEMHRR